MPPRLSGVGWSWRRALVMGISPQRAGERSVSRGGLRWRADRSSARATGFAYAGIGNDGRAHAGAVVVADVPRAGIVDGLETGRGQRGVIAVGGVPHALHP